MTVGVVGLGLIGGSIAKAIKYNTDNKVIGFDIDENVVLKARLLGAIDEEMTEQKISECDIIITGLYPEATKKYITDNARKFKKGAIVLDTCGVKEYVCEDMYRVARENGFTFIGTHPMAGLHLSGFEHSKVTMFSNASMLLVPSADTGIIAFTSQLAHVVSNAYVKSPSAKLHKGFSAGSYKDLTRVAKLNEVMWTELFLENRENLIFEIDTIIENLTEYSKALKEDNAQELEKLLRDGRICKEQIDG